ncbi:MAG TPA: hypothetical protein VJR89_12460, partial [Polyangiales bacterium]|nr:hypothetical protein [Polyangiales bacterium]
MTQLARQRFQDAEQFLWLSARLLERVRFEHSFKAGPREAVLAALRAYQNPDGGFGHAIEPDFRGPVSQPLNVEFAFKVLDEIELPDPALIQPALGFLREVTAADGGLPNVLSNVSSYPRAPWWEAPREVTGCLLPTASIAGLLSKWKIADAWLERAVAYTWRAMDALIERAKTAQGRLPRLQVAYEARATLPFLEHVPDRARAERTASALRAALDAAGMIAREPDPAAEGCVPLELAPHPNALARSWFDAALIERHLAALCTAQQADGGWTVPWSIWTPITEPEWRGILTLEKLKILRAYQA